MAAKPRMTTLHRVGTLAVEFIGLGVLCVFLILWSVRQRRRYHIEPETVTLRDVWRSFWHEVWRIIMRGDPAPTILMLSVLIIAIGVRLVMPADTFGSTVSYGYLNDTALNENTWGVWFIALGFAKLVSLGYNAIPALTPYRLSYYAGCAISAFMALVWVNMALGLMVSNIQSYGYLTYFTLAAMSLWSAARRLRQGLGGR